MGLYGSVELVALWLLSPDILFYEMSCEIILQAVYIYFWQRSHCFVVISNIRNGSSSILFCSRQDQVFFCLSHSIISSTTVFFILVFFLLPFSSCAVTRNLNFFFISFLMYCLSILMIGNVENCVFLKNFSYVFSQMGVLHLLVNRQVGRTV